MIGARQCVNLLYERTATGPAAHIRHTDAMRDMSDPDLLGRVECLCDSVPPGTRRELVASVVYAPMPRIATRAINHPTEYEVLCP